MNTTMKNTVLKDTTVYTSTYTCNSCNSIKEGKPWLSVNFPRKTYHTCSYLCNIKMRDVLPRNYYNLIINKEDFNEPRPFHHNPTYEPFVFLTETEINSLNNDEYTTYTTNLDEELLLNPLRSTVYYEQLENDAYEKAIELDDGSSSEDNHEDDY